MDKPEALELLKSTNAIDRLRAARVLQKTASDQDFAQIQAVLDKESDGWVRQALSQIASRDMSEISLEVNTEVPVVEDPAQLAQDVKVQTTQELTAVFSHELSPIVGSLLQAAQDELRVDSMPLTMQAIGDLQGLLEGVRSLYQASTAPNVTDFNLSDVVFEVRKVVQVEREQRDAAAIKVVTARDDPVLSSGDPNLIRMALLNILRNALEASDPDVGGSGEPVVVNWGVTDVDSWVAIFDRGVGLPSGSSRMGEAGLTTKDKSTHLGVGLTVAKLALQSMNGRISHTPRAGGGVVSEMRWAGIVSDANPPD